MFRVTAKTVKDIVDCLDIEYKFKDIVIPKIESICDLIVAGDFRNIVVTLKPYNDKFYRITVPFYNPDEVGIKCRLKVALTEYAIYVEYNNEKEDIIKNYKEPADEIKRRMEMFRELIGKEGEDPIRDRWLIAEGSTYQEAFDSYHHKYVVFLDLYNKEMAVLDTKYPKVSTELESMDYLTCSGGVNIGT